MVCIYILTIYSIYFIQLTNIYIHIYIYIYTYIVLDGMGDLTTIDSEKRIFYYLGDTSSGTTLLGLNMKDGSVACQGVVPLREIGYVGIAQSIDYDMENDNLVISGLAEGNTTGHSVLRTSGCVEGSTNIGKLEHVGIFGDGTFAPMLHASAIDSKQQRLFVTLAITKEQDAVGVIDLNGKQPMFTIPADSFQHTLLGMQYDTKTESIVGVLPINEAPGGIALQSLKLDGTTPTWKSMTLPTQDYDWLYGNSGTVSALNIEDGQLYVLAGKHPQQPSKGPPKMPEMHLVCIDLLKEKVVETPLVSGLPFGVDSLLEMNYV